MIGGYFKLCQQIAKPHIVKTEDEAIAAAAIEANLLMQLYETDWSDYQHAPSGYTRDIWRRMLEYASDQRLAKLERER